MDAEVQDQTSSEESSMSLDKLTSIYIRMRDSREKLAREHEAKDKEIASQMALVEQELLEICKSMDADSIRTKAGTVVRTVKSRYWTNDWDSMHQFIADHHAFALLEKRIHQTHMKQFLEENPDLAPAGLNVEREYTVVVRRSKES